MTKQNKIHRIVVRSEKNSKELLKGFKGISCPHHTRNYWKAYDRTWKSEWRKAVKERSTEE